MKKTLYDYLEIDPTATPEIISAAYDALLLRYDPDKNPAFAEEAANLVKIIRYAFAVLSDVEQRRKYDEKLRMQTAQAGPSNRGSVAHESVDRSGKAIGTATDLGLRRGQKSVNDSHDGEPVEYAGFWRRYAAVIADGLIVTIPQWAFQYIAFGSGSFDPASSSYWRAMLFSVVVWWLYLATMMSGPRHATLGKSLVGIEVLRIGSLEGVTFAQATGRFIAQYLSFLLLGIGYLMQPFTKHRQALHDILAGTVVVVTREASGWMNLILGGLAALTAIAVAGIGLAIALPAYQDYRIRTNVADAVQVGSDAAQAIEAYIDQFHAVPSGLGQTRFSSSSANVGSVIFDPDDGVVSVTMSFPPLEGHVVTLAASVDSERRIVWHCGSEEIPPKYLPSACRP